MVNMFSKLNIAEFGEATVNQFGKTHLKDVLEIYKNGQIENYGFGPGEKIQLENELKKLYDFVYDYRLIGSLGFTSVAEKTWQLIFKKMTLEGFVRFMDDMIDMSEDVIKITLTQIKGVGPTTADTITCEYRYFRDDIIYCMNNLNIVNTKGSISGKQIRATGFRNRELFQQLKEMGYDADDNGSVTKSTDILLIPYTGYSQGSKIKKASETCQIIPVDEFISNMNNYL
jgi:NAD-dependent DNA ligase